MVCICDCLLCGIDLTDLGQCGYAGIWGWTRSWFRDDVSGIFQG
jgi:hypothetical protein